jgi:hypothetical protein
MRLLTADEQAALLDRVKAENPSPKQLHQWLSNVTVHLIHAETAMCIFDWARHTKGGEEGVYGYEHGLIHLLIGSWCLHWKRTPSYIFCYYDDATYHPMALLSVDAEHERGSNISASRRVAAADSHPPLTSGFFLAAAGWRSDTIPASS